MEVKFFKLFADCIPVKGASRALICDVGRNRFKHIPAALFFILKKYKKKTVEEIKQTFNRAHDEIIDEYFEFLIENEFGFYCNEEDYKLYPPIKLKYEMPSHVSNVIIDWCETSTYNFKTIFDQLSNLHCHFWQLRFYDEIEPSQLMQVLGDSKNIHIRSIHLILKYSDSFIETAIMRLYANFPIIQIAFHSVEEHKIAALSGQYSEYPFYFYSIPLTNETHCGKIKVDYFSVNIETFSEGQRHNTCLNKKIAIDKEGNIKNCPSMQKSYGNISESSLKEVLEKQGFKDLWNINKDKIKVCQDCEFRYICTDCRAYLEDPKDLYSKPLKCGYDPYTATWSEWSTNPLKQKAIEHYGLQELVKK